MDQVLALVFFALSLGLLWRLIRARDVVDFQLGVVAAFSIGYFCLPVWFKDFSRLNFYPAGDLARAVLLFLVFALMVVIGTWVGRQVLPERIAMHTERLDEAFNRRRIRLVLLAFGWFTYYFLTQSVTSYAADDVRGAADRVGSISALMAGAADIALGLIAYNLASAVQGRRRGEAWLSSILLVMCLGMLLLVGQRLAFLTPIVMLMALLFLTGQKKAANGLLVAGVIALAVVSPIAVAVREAPPGSSAVDTIDSFDYGTAPLNTMFQSLIDRGDLLYVTVRMTPILRDDPLPGMTYYGSVLVNAIPSRLFPTDAKPYPLSTNGAPNGELSIYAWQQIRGGSIGSLSAFGGLVAYRELGWAGVLINGLATGVLFVFLARWLGRGGALPMILYSGLFVSLSVKKVPPSFWEAMLALMPVLPFVAMVWLLEQLVARRSGRRHTPTRTTSEGVGR